MTDPNPRGREATKAENKVKGAYKPKAKPRAQPAEARETPAMPPVATTGRRG